MTGYHVQVAGEDSDWKTVNTTPVIGLEFVVNHLQPLKKYKFCVAAENPFGIGEFCQASPFVSCLAEVADEPVSPSALHRFV